MIYKTIVTDYAPKAKKMAGIVKTPVKISVQLGSERPQQGCA